MPDFKIGGDYFSPVNGRYHGMFTGIADGPVTEQTKDRADGSKVKVSAPTIRWAFALYNLDGTPVIDPKKPGTVAVADGLSSATLGIGRGTPSKGRVWLTKLLEAKGLPFVDPQTNEAAQALVLSAVGAWVDLIFGNSPSKRPGTLIEIERLSAATSAPPIVQSVPIPAPVAAPFAPASALPIPAATPFMPVPVPTVVSDNSVTTNIPTTSIPAMPFPAATR